MEEKTSVSRQNGTAGPAVRDAYGQGMDPVWPSYHMAKSYLRIQALEGGVTGVFTGRPCGFGGTSTVVCRVQDCLLSHGVESMGFSATCRVRATPA